MATKKLAAVYKAEDGSEHDTEAAANRRNKLIKASRALDAAADEVTRCLGETGLTADGEPFDMSQSKYYWRIVPNWSGLPRLAEIWLWPHHATVTIDDDTTELVIQEQHTGSPEGKPTTHRINELYAHKKNAVVALALAHDERMRELQAESEEILRRASKT